MITIYLISRWRLFTKMGEKGWVSLVPVYSDIVFIRKIMGTALWLLLPTLGPALSVMMAGVISASSRSISATLSSLIFGYLMAVACVISFLLAASIRLTHSFGKSGWWTVITVLFYPIMCAVYGISDLMYEDGIYALTDDFIECVIRYFKGTPVVSDRPKVNKCKNCGSVLRDGAGFCHNCGEKVPESVFYGFGEEGM